MTINRRRFIASTSAFASSAWLTGCAETDSSPSAPSTEPSTTDFPISLAQWSCHVMLKAGELDNLDWPKFTQDNFDIHALEWVNSFAAVETEKLGRQPISADYIKQMKQRCDDLGMTSVMIMCDGIGQLGNPDTAKRDQVVEGHLAWLDAAKELGCKSIRVNAGSSGRLTPEEQAELCADGLGKLCQKAAPLGLNVIVENHGGLSSDGAWLAEVMKRVGLDNCGTLPDFGNFFIFRKVHNHYEKRKADYIKDHPEEALKRVEGKYGYSYDKYEGVKAMMPFAKGVSAKSRDFTEDGEELSTDYLRMMQIVKDSGYRGHVGIEYEGKDLNEVEGIKKTKALLERVIAQI